MEHLTEAIRIPKELEALAEEARKYKSAEEFIAERGQAIEFYTGRPEELDAAMVKVIWRPLGTVFGRRLPGRVVELNSAFPEKAQRTFMHEIGHSVYTWELVKRIPSNPFQIQKEWNKLSKQEWDRLPSYKKEFGGDFAISNKPEEDFAQAYAAWFMPEQEGYKSWKDLPDSYKAFFTKYFGEHKVYHYPKNLKSFWENAQKDKYLT